MIDVDRWAEIKESLPVGSIVSCVVTGHAPFGVFVKIPGVPFDGLIQITDFKDEGRMTPTEFPLIGSTLRKAAVLGFKETGRQIWLGVKPSQIGIPETAPIHFFSRPSQGRNSEKTPRNEPAEPSSPAISRD
jgi:hypothetical protein